LARMNCPIWTGASMVPFQQQTNTTNRQTAANDCKGRGGERDFDSCAFHLYFCEQHSVGLEVWRTKKSCDMEKEARLSTRE
jgi:hypothetical protein